MEYNFINPDHDIPTKFDTIVIMGEEFETNMFEEVSHLALGPPQALSPIRRRSVRHTKIAMTKQLCDEMTGYRRTCITFAGNELCKLDPTMTREEWGMIKLLVIQKG